MNPRAFAATVGRSWAVVVSAILLGVLAGLGISLLTVPRFTATSRIFLATPGWNGSVSAASDESSPYRGDDFSRQRALSYVRLVTDRDLAQRVITQLGEHISPEQLAAATSAHVLPDTVVIDVSVKDASAVRAARLTDAVATEFCAEIRKLELPNGSLIPTVEPVVTQTALLPRHPAEPMVWSNLVLGATAGLLLGLTVAVIGRARSRTIERGDRVTEIARRPALGFVPLLGVDPVFGDLDSLGRAADPVRSVRAAIAVGYSSVPHQVLVVTAPGPHCGHRAVARALALALAETGRRTVLVEADLRGESSSAETGLTAVVAGHVTLADALDLEDLPGVALLGTGVVPVNPAPLLHSQRMAITLAQLRASFDAVIVIAAPTMPYDDCRAVAALADGIALVVGEGRTRTTDLETAMAGLEVLDVPVFGVIVSYAAGAPVPGARRFLQERSY